MFLDGLEFGAMGTVVGDFLAVFDLPEQVLQFVLVADFGQFRIG